MSGMANCIRHGRIRGSCRNYVFFWLDTHFRLETYRCDEDSGRPAPAFPLGEGVARRRRMRYCAQKSSRETTSSDLASLGHLPLRGRLIRPKRNDEKQWFRRKPVLLCKAPASTAKPWDFHHSVGNAAGIMPVYFFLSTISIKLRYFPAPAPMDLRSPTA